jgi:hypothetical protein
MLWRAAGADPSVAKWGHWPPLEFLNSYSFYLYLIEIYSDFSNLYKECPQSLDLPPLPNYSGSATGGQPFLLVLGQQTDADVWKLGGLLFSHEDGGGRS